MNIKEFENTVKPGDSVIILKSHKVGEVGRVRWNYEFVDFMPEECNLCVNCPGYILLKREDGFFTKNCFRSKVDNNIRLKIVEPKILPDNLFEI